MAEKMSLDWDGGFMLYPTEIWIFVLLHKVILMI